MVDFFDRTLMRKSAVIFLKILVKGYAKMKKVMCEKRFLIFIHS